MKKPTLCDKCIYNQEPKNSQKKTFQCSKQKIRQSNKVKRKNYCQHFLEIGSLNERRFESDQHAYGIINPKTMEIWTNAS